MIQPLQVGLKASQTVWMGISGIIFNSINSLIFCLIKVTNLSSFNRELLKLQRLDFDFILEVGQKVSETGAWSKIINL